MAYTQNTQKLTHEGVMVALRAAIEKASEIGQPQCIVIVDASGETLGELRMTGAKYLSLKSARTKARTAASVRAPSGHIPEEFGIMLGAATQNNVTVLPGGLPIAFGGDVIGAIGVGSGSGEQDVAVGKAALAAIGADPIG